MRSENNPLFTLSISEFKLMAKDLINEVLALKEQEKKQIGNDSSDKEEHFDIKGLAQFLKCSKVSIHKYKKKGLPFYRIGRKILFKKTEVLTFMKSMRNKKML